MVHGPHYSAWAVLVYALDIHLRRRVVKIGARHSAGYVAATVLAAAAVWASPLAGQGGRRATRKVAAAVQHASVELRLAAARSVRHTPVGTRPFEVRLAGNFDGPPPLSRARHVEPPLADT